MNFGGGASEGLSVFFSAVEFKPTDFSRVTNYVRTQLFPGVSVHSNTSCPPKAVVTFHDSVPFSPCSRSHTLSSDTPSSAITAKDT